MYVIFMLWNYISDYVLHMSSGYMYSSLYVISSHSSILYNVVQFHVFVFKFMSQDYEVHFISLAYVIHFIL
jgi:hypothetical protein